MKTMRRSNLWMFVTMWALSSGYGQEPSGTSAPQRGGSAGGANTSVISTGPLAYAINTTENLYLVDLGTAAKTLIGNTGVFLEGLALSPGGQLFGTDTGGLLYSLNPTTAAPTLIGNTLKGNIEGLDYNGTTLLGASFSSPTTIFSVNTSNASTTNIVTATSSTGVPRTMAVLDSNNILISGQVPSTNTLIRINLTTGAVTTIGTMAVHGSQFAAMDFASDGNLYGLDNDGTVWRIDPNTAAVTLIGNTGGDFWLDMTAAPGAVGCPPHTVHGHISTVPSGHLSSIAFHAHHGQHGHTVTMCSPPHHGPFHMTPETEESGMLSSSGTADGLDFVAALNEDGSTGSAKRGTVIQLFGSARGLFIGGGHDQVAENFTPSASGSPLFQTNTLPQVRIGGSVAKVLFSGLAPGLTGVWQINVVVPEEVDAGLAPVTINYEGDELRSIEVRIE